MSKIGLIILIIISLIAAYSMIAGKGRGVNNYIVRNIVGVYILILGLLSILRSNLGLIQGFYLGIAAVVISIITLFIIKRDFSKTKYLNLLGIAIGVLAMYFSYTI